MSLFKLSYIITADAVVFNETMTKILFIKRGKQPYLGDWALPGGHKELDEEMEQTARRELLEETGIVAGKQTMFGSYGAKDRDPRGNYLSIAFYTFCHEDSEMQAGDDASELKWIPIEELDSVSIAFDHRKIVNDARIKVTEDDMIDFRLETLKNNQKIDSNYLGFICPFCCGSGQYSEEEGADEGCDECDSSGWATYEPIGYGEPIRKVGSIEELNHLAKNYTSHEMQEVKRGFSEIEAIARRLVAEHKKADYPFANPSIVVKLFPSETKIKLLQVVRDSEGYLDSKYLGTVSPIEFQSTKEINFYPYFLILICKEEWEDVLSGKLLLPEDWDLSTAIDL